MVSKGGVKQSVQCALDWDVTDSIKKTAGCRRRVITVFLSRFHTRISRETLYAY